MSVISDADHLALARKGKAPQAVVGRRVQGAVGRVDAQGMHVPEPGITRRRRGGDRRATREGATRRGAGAAIATPHQNSALAMIAAAASGHPLDRPFGTVPLRFSWC
jgi:hypothetical protein